jgi:2-oxoglutarate dehydrogenase E1 component
MFDEFGINAGYVEELHSLWQRAPQSVDADWRAFFEGGSAAAPTFGAPANTNGTAHTYAGFPSGNGGSNGNGSSANGPTASAPIANGNANGSGAHANGAKANAVELPKRSGATALALATETMLETAGVQGRVFQLINAYRVRGHLFANLDPLGQPLTAVPELELPNFGLTDADYDAVFPNVGIKGLPERATLRQIVSHLSETYCSSIGVEFTQIEDPGAREWLQDAMESTRNRVRLDESESLRVLTKLTDAEIFEQFIHKNYVGAKRFSSEGAESLIPLLELLIDYAGAHEVEEIVLGMAHRGRLNVLVNVLGKNPREIFAAFDDKHPDRFLGGGDVKYHLGYSNDRVTASGRNVHLTMAFNPSHLEWVNPVVEGRVRAKQDRGKRKSVMPLLIHGDAAFMGQGVVPETLNMAGLEGYGTGGTIHVVVNNQIGFTTVPEDSRSTRYCTDITRMMKVPVFHVNGEDPEAVIQVTRLAMEFRARYAKDVVIDMYCYRKYGHNEGDEPRFTQPVMYALIDQKPTVREAYVKRLVAGGRIRAEQAEQITQERRAVLDRALGEARAGDYLQKPNAMQGVWKGFRGGPEVGVPEVTTSVPRDVLLSALEKMAKVPKGFHANLKVLKQIEQRYERASSNHPVDWGTGEHLAFATLILDGRHVRLSGQDSRRGTFSHRHAVLFDTQDGARYTPLSSIGATGNFEVWDSPLSEAGVLGFEYGYSLDSPDSLVLWEAQFGDFLNTAQVIVDQFIASAEDKWLRLAGLVLLLPHGYEGQGPEHSSARVERFLQMCAEDNIQVCNLTTPAQFFHVLRRQVLRPWRKPLVVFTPKSLLRHPAAVSSLEEFTDGAFQRVIPSKADPSKVTKILLCSGKVYYDLAEGRKARGREDVAIVRLEQLYPLHDEIVKALAPYKKGTPLVWVQEEPRNMGGWYFINSRLRDVIGDRLPLSYVARAESASPATGSHASHQLEQKMLIEAAFKE